MTPDRTTVVIATPIEDDLVERLRTEVDGLEVLYDPALLPPPRYPCDHRGAEGFRRDAAGQRRFDAFLERAEVTLGVPGDSPDGLRGLVAAAPRLRWVQGTAAGAGQLVRAAGLEPAELERVAFTSSVGIHAAQLAEWAVLGLLAFVKDLPRLQRERAGRRWEHRPVGELAGRRLLVVGLGAIGTRVASYADALGMRVTGVRRDPSGPAVPGVERVVGPEDLARLVPSADAVVLALPATTATDGLFSADLVRALPDHAVVVNVGRGATIDEPALVEALRAGRLAGAALDVTAVEPLPSDSPLWELDNVLLSPHTAALSTRENERIVSLFAENLRRYRSGEPLRNLVDTTHFY